jgi:glycosyltransferase involved in cell wall biosynthesis
MHVLIVSEHFHKRPSGPRNAILGLCSGLIELGHAVSLVGIAKKHEDETLPGGGSARLRRYPWRVIPVRHGRHRYFARQMQHIHRAAPVDAVIAMGLTAGTAAREFKRRTGVPWLLNPRADLAHKPGAPRYELASELMSQCDAFVGISRSHTRLWCEDLGVEPGPKHFAAHNGWDPGRLEGADERPPAVPADLLEHGPVILCMGIMRKVKGHELLLRAAAGLVHPSWRLVLGGDGPERAAYEALAAELGLTDRVVFAGMVEGPHWRWLYRHADVFCLYPTYAEAFGNVFIESQGAGLPVVSSDNGAIPEIVLHEQTGLIVPWQADTPQRSIDGIRDALGRLLDDEDLRRKLGQAGRQRAAEFTWRRAAEEYGKAIKYALGEA